MNYWMPFSPQLTCTLKSTPPTIIYILVLRSSNCGSSTPQFCFVHFDDGFFSRRTCKTVGWRRDWRMPKGPPPGVSTESLQPKWHSAAACYAGGFSSLSSAASSRPSSTSCVRVGSSLTLMHSMVASIALVLSSTADVAMASSMTVG